MKKYLSFLLVFLVLSTVVFCSCDEDEVKTPSELPESTIHYIIFKIDDNEKARIPVVEGETYTDLEPFFPTIPAEYGDEAYWEVKEVWSNYIAKIEINLIYGDALTPEETTTTTIEN